MRFVAKGYNPFRDVTPSFGPFQQVLGSKVSVFLALVWAIAFVYTAYHLLESMARMARARRGGYGDDLAQTRSDLGAAAAATVGLAAVPVVYAILVS